MWCVWCGHAFPHRPTRALDARPDQHLPIVMQLYKDLNKMQKTFLKICWKFLLLDSPELELNTTFDMTSQVKRRPLYQRVFQQKVCKKIMRSQDFWLKSMLSLITWLKLCWKWFKGYRRLSISKSKEKIRQMFAENWQQIKRSQEVNYYFYHNVYIPATKVYRTLKLNKIK